MRRKVIGLFVANTLTFVIVGVSFLVYSRLLSPPELGLYAAALSLATVLALVLDGGLKTSVIKMGEDLTRERESSIAVLMVLFSFLLITLLMAAEKQMLIHFPASSRDVRFTFVYVAIALLFYPFFTLPTARLERELEYGHIAWIESISMLLERGSPAVFLLWTKAGIYSFVIGLFLSRIFRTMALASFYWVNIRLASWRAAKESLKLVREGAWIQIGTLSSVVRDNLHTLLIGPLYGKQWIGYYAWALQVCLMSSQIFAQLSARVSLPVFAQSGGFEERWPKCLYQIKLLMILTAPVLCGVWFIIPLINNGLFDGKWSPALILIPLMFARMIPGLATTPLGPLLMVHKGGMVYAKVNLVWTALEIAGALIFTRLIGPSGLAWSYAIFVWLGLWMLMNSLRARTSLLARQVATELFRRPSLIFSLLVFYALALSRSTVAGSSVSAGTVYAITVTLVLCSYLWEPDLRRMLLHGRA